MARPLKEGLLYFSLDIDVFEDDKLFDIQNLYGPLGEIIYLRLLCLIYKNGYYYKFDNLDKLAAMLIKSIGNRWARDKQQVKQVILCCAESNLFSLELMQNNVLTSASIQKRYFKAAERRNLKTDLKYIIVTDSEIVVSENTVNADNNSINVNNNLVNVDNNTTKKSKVNKSKEKKSIDNKPAAKKHKYGEFQNVLLSDEELSKLKEKFPDYQQRIENLSMGIELKGYKYKNHYLAILKWAENDSPKEKPKQEVKNYGTVL